MHACKRLYLCASRMFKASPSDFYGLSAMSNRQKRCLVDVHLITKPADAQGLASLTAGAGSHMGLSAPDVPSKRGPACLQIRP